MPSRQRGQLAITLGFRGPNYAPDADSSVPLILFPEGCAYRRCAVNALKDHKRPWHLSFVSPSFECLKSAAVEGMGITVLALQFSRYRG